MRDYGDLVRFGWDRMRSGGIGWDRMRSDGIGWNIGVSALPIKIVGIIFHGREKMMLFTLMRV